MKRDFQISEIISDAKQSGRAYFEFLRVPSLSCGLYTLPANGVDTQLPHTEDEVYYVLSGEGKVRVKGKDYDVRKGSIILVRAKTKHRFHSILEKLDILVFFAPAEYTNSTHPRKKK